MGQFYGILVVTLLEMFQTCFRVSNSSSSHTEWIMVRNLKIKIRMKKNKLMFFLRIDDEKLLKSIKSFGLEFKI